MQATNTVNNGEMAAVWLKAEQEVTLKRVYRERERIRLQPANSQMKPMYHDPGNVEVQGKVIGVIRSLTKPD
jgi:repressor LexA